MSVRELTKIFEETSGLKIPTVMADRRVGDVDTLICDARRANEELDWHPIYDVVRMCKLRFAKLQIQYNRTEVRYSVYISSYLTFESGQDLYMQYFSLIPQVKISGAGKQ